MVVDFDKGHVGDRKIVLGLVKLSEAHCYCVSIEWNGATLVSKYHCGTIHNSNNSKRKHRPKMGGWGLSGRKY
jgi:hypothetical protein